jgi:hypothetical protein
VLSVHDRRRFFAALIAGQAGGVLALVVFGSVLIAMPFGFLASAAGPLLLARRDLSNA